MLDALDLQAPTLMADVCHLEIVDCRQNHVVYQTPSPEKTALHHALETLAHLLDVCETRLHHLETPETSDLHHHSSDDHEGNPVSEAEEESRG